MHTQF